MRERIVDSCPVSGAAALLGRLLLSTVFLVSAYTALAAPGETIGYIAAVGLPLPQLGFAVQMLIEIGCGVALLVGYHARLVAGVLAAFCVATALLFHMNLTDGNELWQLLKNLAIAGGLLQVVAFGAGRFSMDGLRRAASQGGSNNEYSIPST